MKKFLTIIGLTILSTIIYIACTTDFNELPTNVEEASTLLQKGSSKWLTPEEAQVMIDSAVNAALADVQAVIDTGVANALAKDPLVLDGLVNFTKGVQSDFGSDWGNLEWRNIFYGRRQTNKDDFLGIDLLEEINDRDFFVEINGGGGNSGLWIDGNGRDSGNNVFLTSSGGTNYTQLWFTQDWFMVNSYSGVYCLPHLKTFNTNQEAKDYFTNSQFWRRNGTLWVDAQGVVHATIPEASAKVSSSKLGTSIENSPKVQVYGKEKEKKQIR